MLHTTEITQGPEPARRRIPGHALDCSSETSPLRTRYGEVLPKLWEHETHKCCERRVNRRLPKPWEHEPVCVSRLFALGIAYASLDTRNSDIAEYELPQVPSRPFPFLEEGPVTDWKSSLGALRIPEWCQVGTVPGAALSTLSLGSFISAVVPMPL